MDEKLNYFEASFLIVIVVISHIILEFPNVIIRSTLSASVINIIYITALAIVFFLIVVKLFKPFNGNNILYVAEYVGGKTLKTILSSIYVCYFIFISSLIILAASISISLPLQLTVNCFVVSTSGTLTIKLSSFTFIE